MLTLLKILGLIGGVLFCMALGAFALWLLAMWVLGQMWSQK